MFVQSLGYLGKIGLHYIWGKDERKDRICLSQTIFMASKSDT